MAEVLQTLPTDGVTDALMHYRVYFTPLFFQANASDELSPYSLLTTSMTVGIQVFTVNPIFQ